MPSRRLASAASGKQSSVGSVPSTATRSQQRTCCDQHVSHRSRRRFPWQSKSKVSIVTLLRSEIQRTYASCLERSGSGVHVPHRSRLGADLGYPPDLLARIPETSCESFAGVANPFSLGPLMPGEVVLDIGCGAGMDTLIAAQMVGHAGSVTGIDMTPDMVAKARRSTAAMGPARHHRRRQRRATAVRRRQLRRRHLKWRHRPDPRQGRRLRRNHPRAPAGGRIELADVTIQRPVSEEGKGNVEPVGRVNRKGSAGSRVREPPAAPRLHRHSHRRPGRHLRPLSLRGHAREGTEVRRPRHNLRRPAR